MFQDEQPSIPPVLFSGQPVPWLPEDMLPGTDASMTDTSPPSGGCAGEYLLWDMAVGNPPE